MKLKKILKIVSIMLIAAAAGIFLAQIANATYSIPGELRPNNAPFDLSNVNEENLYTSGEGGSAPLILILQILAGALLYVAAPLAVISVALAAFNMVMFGGSNDKVEEAKRQLTWAILGLITITLSFALIRFLIFFVFATFSDTPEPVATTTSPTSYYNEEIQLPNHIG